MKLYYTRTWKAEISEEEIWNECKPYFIFSFSSFTREHKNHIIDAITNHVVSKYTSYEFSKLPKAFLQPLKAQVRQYLESFPVMVALMKEGEY